MRILVVGDTHGRISPVLNEIKRIQFDYMLFTGDFITDADKIAQKTGVKYQGVRGNCDLQTGCEEQIITIDGKRIYLIHGHQYAVKRGYELLWQRGLDLKTDIVVFGHTHKAYCQKTKGLWMINPGSPSFPRTLSATYALLNIEAAEVFADIIEF